MTFVVRLLCFLAIFGLFGQLVPDGAMAVTCPDDHHEAASASDGCCGENEASHHSSTDPMHDCCSMCVHFFAADSYVAETFQVRVQDPVSFLSSGREVWLEGFPSGLFIPPRLS